MRKIPTLFVRDFEHGNGRYVIDRIISGCEWVFAGEGVATRKYDGTCMWFDDNGDWWARREVKPGKTPPPNFAPIETDDTTGKVIGWEPISQSSFAKFHAEAVERVNDAATPGTYELPAVSAHVRHDPGGRACACRGRRLRRHRLAPPGWAYGEDQGSRLRGLSLRQGRTEQ